MPMIATRGGGSARGFGRFGGRPGSIYGPFIDLTTTTWSSGLVFATDFNSTGYVYQNGSVKNNLWSYNSSGHATGSSTRPLSNSPYMELADGGQITPEFQPNWGSYSGATIYWWGLPTNTSAYFMAWGISKSGGSDAYDAWHSGSTPNQIVANSFDGDGTPFSPILTYSGPSTWAAIAFTWNPSTTSTIKGYKNGSYVGQTSNTWGQAGSFWRIGTAPSSSYAYSGNKMGFMAVWNRQLDATEISNFHSSVTALSYS